MKTKNKVRRILQRAHRSPNKGKFLLAKMNNTASHVRHDVDHYITKRPYQAMGVTLLTGLCLGFLIHR